MKIHIVKSNILELQVDAIVSPANRYLSAGGGLSGKIFRSAGEEIIREVKGIKEELDSGILKIGSCVSTGAYKLPQKYVIHTVGPNIMNYKHITSEEEKFNEVSKLLYLCYKNSFEKANSLNCKSIAYPSISTGSYGVDVGITVQVVKYFLDNLPKETTVEEIYIVLFDDKTYDLFKDTLSEYVEE